MSILLGLVDLEMSQVTCVPVERFVVLRTSLHPPVDLLFRCEKLSLLVDYDDSL